jgi:hypothetical protein
VKQFPCLTCHQILDSVYIINKMVVEISVEKSGNSNSYGSIHRPMLIVESSYDTKGTEQKSVAKRVW